MATGISGHHESTRRGFLAVVMVMLLGTVVLCAGMAVPPALAASSYPASPTSPTLFVKLSGFDASILKDKVDALGLEVVKVIPQAKTAVVRQRAGHVPAGAWTAPQLVAAVGALSSVPGVKRVEVGCDKTASLVPNDPYYPFVSNNSPGQWGPPQVGLEEVWGGLTDSASVTLAVLDSGLAQDILDFSGRVVSPFSTLNESSLPAAWDDVFGHGSGVAGVAAAGGNNRYGIAGVAWGVSIMPVHFTNDGRVNSDDYLEAIYYAVDHGADVINISYGSTGTWTFEREAIQYALDHGVVVVAAAGNRSAGVGIDYPAALPGVIAVGATDQDKRRASFSCTGPELDLMAPGVKVLTYHATSSTFSLVYTQGTSFSTPVVAGVAALMLSVNPALTPTQVEQYLRQSAEDLGATGFDQQFGYGLLNAPAAVALAGGGSTTTTTTQATTTTTQATTTTTTTATTTTTTAPLSTTTTTQPTTTTTLPAPPVFTDVRDGDPYRTAIEGLAREGVVTGYTDGTFRPREPLWRAQFAKMICELMDLEVSESMQSAFTDLGPDNLNSLYPHEYVAAAAAAGITKGTSPTTFAPYTELSRAQAITMIVRAGQALASGLFTEPPADYRGSFGAFDLTHGPNMRIAEYNGILVGLENFGPSWNPWRVTNRGEVAQMLWQFWLLRL